jgi:putative glycosyltransferase (TIGR04372 family)
MKYGIWRHENALGNSAEEIVNLNYFIQEAKDENPIIYVETEFQRDYALCIPNVKPENVLFYDKEINLDNLHLNKHKFQKQLEDIYMPHVYFSNFKLHYPSTWETIKTKHTLVFPEKIYDNKHNLPKGAIVISVREPKTYWKRCDGDYCDIERYVNPQPFFEIALECAEAGYTVVRVGDNKQTPFPKHKNIIDFAFYNDRTMLDDLFLIYHSRVYLACDSGIWPMQGGFKKNLVLSNVTSSITGNKPEVVNWLSKETTRVLFKKQNPWRDNTKEELIENMNFFLGEQNE